MSCYQCYCCYDTVTLLNSGTSKGYSYDVAVPVWCCQMKGKVAARVKSGSDDPDNLGHLGHFIGGSHPQTKLSECDPDITCSLENSVSIW